MGSDGLVTGVEALAKHKVAGPTSVTSLSKSGLDLVPPAVTPKPPDSREARRVVRVGVGDSPHSLRVHLPRRDHNWREHGGPSCDVLATCGRAWPGVTGHHWDGIQEVGSSTLLGSI